MPCHRAWSCLFGVLASGLCFLGLLRVWAARAWFFVIWSMVGCLFDGLVFLDI